MDIRKTSGGDSGNGSRERYVRTVCPVITLCGFANSAHTPVPTATMAQEVIMAAASKQHGH